MKTKLIKTTMCSLLFASSLVTLAAVAMTSATARADSDCLTCGVQTLHGSYVFNAHGWNIVSGVAQPKAIVEGIDFNGDGTLSVPFATLSINGVIIQVPPGGTGTYTLDATCQGTLKTTAIMARTTQPINDTTAPTRGRYSKRARPYAAAVPNSNANRALIGATTRVLAYVRSVSLLRSPSKM